MPLTLDEKFGDDLLMRSAAWLTSIESRATFAIERESDRKDDIRRFASAMLEHCGKIDDPLSDNSLIAMQKDVLGHRALRTGIRESPVFVGSAAHHSATVVQYVAASPQQVPGLMAGLRAFDERTKGSSTLARAGVLAFGFVYIHPLADGNGRLHRLLVNDTLQREGMVPSGIILPISSTIVKSSINRGRYMSVLNRISDPLMRRYSTSYRFGNNDRVCPDGVVTDFEFDAYEDAAHLWRYPDLSEHCHFVADMVRVTIVENMTQEAGFLSRHDEARARLKLVYEMPDRDADTIVRSLRENAGRVTSKLLKAYESVFEDPAIAGDVIEGVMSALEGREAVPLPGDDQPQRSAGQP